MSPLGKVEMSPFVPRKPSLLRVLNGLENKDVKGAIYDEHRRGLEVISKVVDKHVTQVIAARQLGITERQIKRLVKRYHAEGAEGLKSKQRGQVAMGSANAMGSAQWGQGLRFAFQSLINLICKI